MKKTNYSYLVWGFLFLTIGIIWAGNIGNYWYVDIPYLLFYKGFWTFFIILPCIVNIFQKRISDFHRHCRSCQFPAIFGENGCL